MVITRDELFWSNSYFSRNSLFSSDTIASSIKHISSLFYYYLHLKDTVSTMNTHITSNKRKYLCFHCLFYTYNLPITDLYRTQRRLFPRFSRITGNSVSITNCKDWPTLVESDFLLWNMFCQLEANCKNNKNKESLLLGFWIIDWESWLFGPLFL